MSLIDTIETKKILSLLLYLKIEPDFREDFAEYLLRNHDYDGAAAAYSEIMKDDRFASKKGKSTF